MVLLDCSSDDDDDDTVAGSEEIVFTLAEGDDGHQDDNWEVVEEDVEEVIVGEGLSSLSPSCFIACRTGYLQRQDEQRRP